MCGISGIFDRRGSANLDLVRAMQSSLIHRGPDGDGLFHEGPIALAHQRLSIIDLSGGAQPLLSLHDDLVLVANGEIYNYPEIRNRFINDGYEFKTQSDCEVILPLYEKYGSDCVSHLRGMFAFALWDKNKKRLLLARDRMGEKPLYYAFSQNRLYFASELRSMLKADDMSSELEPGAIFRYFRYQYVPEPETPFKDVRKLPAASTIEIDLQDWALKLRKYWEPWTTSEIQSDPVASIRESIEDSVKMSIVSDVPIGLSLSGGVDSSILACLMKKYCDKELHAISIGYPDAGMVDERPQARALANKLDIEFHDVELTDSEMIEKFPEIATLRDDPVGDISGFNYYAIMRHARENNIKVMLQGHGLDELCWGYGWVQKAVAYNEIRQSKGIHKILATRGLLNKLATLKEVLSNGRTEETSAFKMYELQPYTDWVMKNRSNIFSTNFLQDSGWTSDISASDYGETSMRVDLEVTRLILDFYLLGNGITQGDRLSMANSVEVRLPFVDYKFIETVIGLRKANRDDHLSPKHWLKESVRDLLGDEVLSRPKKGFAPPGVRWQQALRKNFGEELRDGYLVKSGILSQDAANKFSLLELTNPNEAIVSRLALTLEFWTRGVLGYA